jgi:flagellar P-ring protein precursor FlgI
MYKFMRACHLLVLISLFVFNVPSWAERIKDMATIYGIRSNQLIGYGLVVGLDGTGDNSEFTGQSFKTMLSRLGVQLPADAKAQSKNIAAVVIHSELPPFAKPGQQIDVTVSSIGNAKSLRGGTLLLSQLSGADGKIYAVAQGNLVVGGFGAEGSDGSKIKVNVPVVGRIPNGATIEAMSPAVFNDSNTITYLLHRVDFTTAQRMADAINEFIGNNTAIPADGSSVIVKVPKDVGERVRFLSALENVALTPGEEAAKVIVNSRTGTIVVGQYVTVGSAAVSHGSLTVTITEKKEVSQPMPGSEGKTTVTNESNINVAQKKSKMFILPEGTSLKKIVNAINEVGASPGDLMAILEALKRSGALNAELEII